MTISQAIDTQLRAAGIPILGVSIGIATDRSTWRVDFDPTATAAQRTQAATIIDTAVVDAPTLSAKDVQAQIDNLPVLWQKIVFALLDQINVLRAQLGLSAISTATAITAIRNRQVP